MGLSLMIEAGNVNKMNLGVTLLPKKMGSLHMEDGAMLDVVKQ